MAPVPILFVSHGAALGGSPISCYKLMANLSRDEFSPVFASREQGPVLERVRAAGIPCHLISRKGLLGLGYIFRFLRLIRREKVGLVHLNTLTSYYKYPALAARLCRVPIVWFVREDPESKRGRRLFPWIRRLADVIVTVSYDTREKMFSGKAPANAKVVHNGVDLQEFSPEPNRCLHEQFKLSPQLKLVGTVSSLEERKGVEFLLRAVSIIKRRNENFRLIIVGEDRSRDKSYLGKMRRIIEEEDISRLVILAGPRPDVARLMNGLDVFVLPTLWEGLARTILEAMACGLPVVATRVGGNPEQVRHDFNGLLVPPGDPQALAEAIACLLEDDRKRSQMGRAGRLRAEREFSLPGHVREVEKIYRGLRHKRWS